MSHSLFSGMTEMGKTTLARDMSAVYERMGFDNLVLDPLKDKRWRATVLTADSDEFLWYAKRSTRCMLFIDEGSESVGRYNTPMQWLATQSRHWGHSAHFIVQSAVQIAPIIRDMCSRVFLFASGRRAAKLLSEEFNAPDLELCTSLRKGEYFAAVKGGACTFHSLPFITEKRSLEDVLSSHSRRSRIDGRRHQRIDKEPDETGDQTGDQAGDQTGDQADSGQADSDG